MCIRDSVWIALALYTVSAVAVSRRAAAMENRMS